MEGILSFPLLVLWEAPVLTVEELEDGCSRSTVFGGAQDLVDPQAAAATTTTPRHCFFTPSYLHRPAPSALSPRACPCAGVTAALPAAPRHPGHGPAVAHGQQPQATSQSVPVLGPRHRPCPLGCVPPAELPPGCPCSRQGAGPEHSVRCRDAAVDALISMIRVLTTPTLSQRENGSPGQAPGCIGHE